MITNKLSLSGLKQTFQRRKILEFLENTKSHPTADAIYKKIVKDIPGVSKTTVYNTVNKLAEEGIIKCIKTENSEMRFDAVTEPHYHFVCDKCAKVYDVGICCKNVLRYDIDGHKVEDVFICYNGICKTCKKANKKG
ncbi:MAG: transcriptional repressor [Endomicrobia bacterium]|nr:transcriptional repressor [Endomicrobiia bacterium]